LTSVTGEIASRSRRAVAIAALGIAAAALGAGLVQTDRADGAKARSSIIGGHRADPADWPFIAAIYFRGQFICGGSVISPTRVLTAAHCAKGIRIAKMRVVTGRPILKEKSVGQKLKVASKLVHPDYAKSQRHDVAVLTLAEATTAPPVTLADANEDATYTVPGTLLRVAGYGARDQLGFRLPGFLKETSESVRANRRCRRVYGKRFFSGATMICAQGRRIPRARGVRTQICSGDSGGPLVADTPSGVRQVGIVSYAGLFCGDSFTPSAYARVSDALDFIN
jgi:secreted trypsin-like serine protease